MPVAGSIASWFADQQGEQPIATAEVGDVVYFGAAVWYDSPQTMGQGILAPSNPFGLLALGWDYTPIGVPDPGPVVTNSAFVIGSTEAIGGISPNGYVIQVTYVVTAPGEYNMQFVLSTDETIGAHFVDADITTTVVIGTPRTVTVDLYTNANPPALLNADIPVQSGGFWTDLDSDAGSAEVVIPQRGFAGIANATEGRLLRFNVNGTPDRTVLIERVSATVKSATPSAEVRTLSGRDWLAEFEDALVDPPLGVSNVPAAQSVRFDWTHPNLIRPGGAIPGVSWISPTSLGMVYKANVDPLNQPIPPSFGGKVGQAPRGWPDALSTWFWTQADTGPGGNPAYSTPTGIGYFYLAVNAVAPGAFVKGTNIRADLPLILVWTADDIGELAFDGAVVDSGSQPPAIQWQRCASVGIPELSVGTHHICAKVTNLPFDLYGGAYNVGSFALCAFQPLESNGFDPVENLVIRTAAFPNGSNLITGGRWDCIFTFFNNQDNPDSGTIPAAPGFTVGRAFRLMFQRAQLAGHLPGWTLSFDDNDDTDGNAWPVTDTLNAKVSSTLLDVIRQWHDEGHWDVAARPGTRVLDAWRFGERGNYSPDPLNINPLTWSDVHLSEVTVEGQR